MHSDIFAHLLPRCVEEILLHVGTIIRKFFPEEFTNRDNADVIPSLCIPTEKKNALLIGKRIGTDAVFMLSENKHDLYVTWRTSEMHTCSLLFLQTVTLDMRQWMMNVRPRFVEGLLCKPKVLPLLCAWIFTKMQWASTLMSVRLKMNLEIHANLQSLGSMIQEIELQF